MRRLKMLVCCVAALSVATITLLEKMGLKEPDLKEAEALNERVLSMLKQAPWKILTVPAEDGLFLLPLLYLGINPVTAVVAATLFAAFHYPSFPWHYCVPKGIAYFFVALFVLPYGIWSVVTAHLLLDGAIFCLLMLRKVKGNPMLQRLARAIGVR